MERHRHSRGALLIGAAVVAGALLAAQARPAQALSAHAPDAAAAVAAEGAEGDHRNPVVDLVAKLLNFGILAGTLVYFLRSPLNRYLTDRGTQIRADLVKAAEMKTAAANQVEAVEQKMAALPSELDALRKTGAAEVAAEETRIREAAEKERARLLAQLEREIDQHGKAAERDLLRLAADKAVAIATADVTRTITPADHARLVDRYVETVRAD